MAACPMPAARAPTGNTRNNAPELSGWSCAVRRWAKSASSPAAHRAVRLEAARLIDQHDRDVVLDRIREAARVTHELLVGRRAVLERPFALGANQQCAQLWSETHVRYPRRFRVGAWRRQRGNTLTCRSRKIRLPTRDSILARAAVPSALMASPPAPITMPFWLSRST